MIEPYLDAVANAVSQAWKTPFIRVIGFFLVKAKYTKGRVMQAWTTKPATTVTMYNPSLWAIVPTSSNSSIFPQIRNIIPTGEYLKI